MNERIILSRRERVFYRITVIFLLSGYIAYLASQFLMYEKGRREKEMASNLTAGFKTLCFILEARLTDTLDVCPRSAREFVQIIPQYGGLPIDPRTQRPFVIETIRLTPADWKKLQSGDQEIAKRFSGKFVAYYVRFSDNSYCLFSTDLKGQCPFGKSQQSCRLVYPP